MISQNRSDIVISQIRFLFFFLFFLSLSPCAGRRGEGLRAFIVAIPGDLFIFYRIGKYLFLFQKHDSAFYQQRLSHLMIKWFLSNNYANSIRAVSPAPWLFTHTLWNQRKLQGEKEPRLWPDMRIRRISNHPFVKRLWHFSTSIISFFKHACAAIQWC